MINKPLAFLFCHEASATFSRLHFAPKDQVPQHRTRGSYHPTTFLFYYKIRTLLSSTLQCNANLCVHQLQRELSHSNNSPFTPYHCFPHTRTWKKFKYFISELSVSIQKLLDQRIFRSLIFDYFLGVIRWYLLFIKKKIF